MASFSVGTAAELIASGPPQPCAGCVLAADAAAKPKPKQVESDALGMPRNNGLFAQRGWTFLCSIHKPLAQIRDESDSFAATLPAPTRAQQPPVVSMSARWGQIQKKQELKARRQKKGIAAKADRAAGISDRPASPCQKGDG